MVYLVAQMLTVQSVPLSVFTERLRHATSYRDVVRVFLSSPLPLRDEDIDTFITSQLTSERHSDVTQQHALSWKHDAMSGARHHAKYDVTRTSELRGRDSDAQFMTSSWNAYGNDVMDGLDYADSYFYSDAVMSPDKYESLEWHDGGRGISISARSMDSVPVSPVSPASPVSPISPVSPVSPVSQGSEVSPTVGGATDENESTETQLQGW